MTCCQSLKAIWRVMSLISIMKIFHKGSDQFVHLFTLKAIVVIFCSCEKLVFHKLSSTCLTIDYNLMINS